MPTSIEHKRCNYDHGCSSFRSTAHKNLNQSPPRIKQATGLELGHSTRECVCYKNAVQNPLTFTNWDQW